MDSKKYWRLEEVRNLLKYAGEEQEYEQETLGFYQDMLDDVQKEIESFYARYAQQEGITHAEARRRITQADVAVYERKARRYAKEKTLSPQAEKELRLYNAAVKTNRLELLHANIGLELTDGHNRLEQRMGTMLTKRTTDELKRQSGLLGKRGTISIKDAEKIVNESFYNAHYSDRLWTNQRDLKRQLERVLKSGLIRGKSAGAMVRDVEKEFQAGLTSAVRLMRTELARVQTGAQKLAFEQSGFEEYLFIMNGSGCERCAALDGKHFKVSEMEIGKNAPPLHPNCRCSTAPYEDSQEYDEWLEHLDKGGTTEEWEKQKAVEKGDESGIMESNTLTKLNPDHSVANPMDEQRYRAMKEKLESRGCSVIAAHGDDERFLIAFGAEAISDEYGIIHLGDVPSASAFFEEIIHYTQMKKYGPILQDDLTERAAREVAANRMLLKHAKAYGFTDEDYADIKHNLEIWEKDFEKRMGICYGESNLRREI